MYSNVKVCQTPISSRSFLNKALYQITVECHWETPLDALRHQIPISTALEKRMFLSGIFGFKSIFEKVILKISSYFSSSIMWYVKKCPNDIFEFWFILLVIETLFEYDNLVALETLH